MFVVGNSYSSLFCGLFRVVHPHDKLFAADLNTRIHTRRFFFVSLVHMNHSTNLDFEGMCLFLYKLNVFLRYLLRDLSKLRYQGTLHVIPNWAVVNLNLVYCVYLRNLCEISTLMLSSIQTSCSSVTFAFENQPSNPYETY